MRFGSTLNEDIVRLPTKVSAQNMSAESTPDLQLEIAHLLLIDVVGYSKLLVNEQIEVLQQLNQIVRTTACFRAAEASDKLLRVPTGDGMALFFFCAARKSRCDALWKLAQRCMVIRSSKYAWAFTAARSIGSPMSMTKQTSRAPESIWPSECWTAVTRGTFFCPRISPRISFTIGIGNHTCTTSGSAR